MKSWVLKLFGGFYLIPPWQDKNITGYDKGTRIKQNVKILTPMPTGMPGICGTAGKFVG